LASSVNKKERGGQRYSSSLGVGTHPSPCGVSVVDTLQFVSFTIT
jgi:hypothetical protein